MPAKFKGKSAVGRLKRLAHPAKPAIHAIIDIFRKEKIPAWRFVDAAVRLLAMDALDGNLFPRELFHMTDSAANRALNEYALDQMAIGWKRLQKGLRKLADAGEFGEAAAKKGDGHG